MIARHRQGLGPIMAALALVSAWGCSEEASVGLPVGGDGGAMVDAAGAGGMGGGVDVGPGGMGGGPGGDMGPGGCDPYQFRGESFFCSQLDRCNEQNISFRLACCECDPQLCNPPPGGCVPDQPDGGVPPADMGVPPQPEPVESCMRCHNGAAANNDYSGNGLSNPHPFPPAAQLRCTQCHGGNPNGGGKEGSHVPAPPSIGDKQFQANNPQAWFNRLTLTGIDKLQPATYQGPDGAQWTNLDFLQFVNPGDLRVVAEGRGCGEGGCHLNEHAQWVTKSMIATTNGLMSGARYTVGVDNRIPENRNLDQNTASDVSPRAVQNPNYNPNNRDVGEVGRLQEHAELAQFTGTMRDNGNYAAANLPNHIINANQDPAKPNRVRAGSPLEHLIDEQISMTCGDCHLYSAGANNRYADFRSSGCTACHMEYSYDGRSRSGDPNVNRFEPANPDQIAAPERAHIEVHQIRNVAKILPNGAFVRGISDRACVGCHQGSNRTVLQYWGVRMDQNADVVNDTQYPANPNTFADTAADTRLYDPAVNNQTFNGRNANQHLLEEDYDGDNRDDTPPDVHYEAGLGCIDCHGSRDLH
ncbi:MAG: hypothetical protein KC613_02715, partial [Myxococcales bacterium]|nr:hypothetical protein [Myxococcales bacterium]